MDEKLKCDMSERVKKLHEELMQKAQGDRSQEWFTQKMFPTMNQIDSSLYGYQGSLEEQTVLIRRAIAIDIMLKAMTDPKNSETTETARIHGEDLLLGNMPMASNGLGKVFPQYMTETELRVASVTNRSSTSLFGHNTVNYETLLNNGLETIITKAKKGREKRIAQLKELKDSPDYMKIHILNVQKDFYKSVEISCQAVIDYAEEFAKIAEKEADNRPKDSIRYNELIQMAQIARKVPKYPAQTFHEAMQSITFFHVALHSSMNFLSLGRLDQVLNPYLEKETDKNRALEIFECFLVKLAWRINLSSDYLIEQDHANFGTVLGTHSYYMDQKAGINNFLQNIILSGKTPEGEDATNPCTHLILQAFGNVNLSTPGVYVRMSTESPQELTSHVAKILNKTKNNPAICNDDIMIPAFYKALMQDDLDALTSKKPTPEMLTKREEMQKLANDYCVDGCWEPILNGKCDWTFAMLNIMNVLESAINQGATVLPPGPLLKGKKIAPTVETPTSFEHLMELIEHQTKFFTDQSILSLFLYYMIDEYVCPSPLFSAVLDGCMERGRDKSWGGADYNLGGLIYGGVPNLVNTLAAIRKWVFPKEGQGKYTFDNILNAFRNNFASPDPTETESQELYTSIEIDFNTNSPKFGNGDFEADQITNQILDICYESTMNSGELAKKVFQHKHKPENIEEIYTLRNIAGYYGPSLEKKFGEFAMKITVGLGTFEQYHWQGSGIAASADRRTGDPLAPNFSPVPGTVTNGFPGICDTFTTLNLDRFAGGVITDICLDDQNIDTNVLETILTQAIDRELSMFTLTIGSKDIYKKIYETVRATSLLVDKTESAILLAKYASINVRIGGWQTPFITLPLVHMKNYIERPIASTTL